MADMPTYPTRYAYAEAVQELAAANPDVVLLNADVAKSMRTNEFAERFPDREFNFGIAEQNMMAAAAGMATVGLIPFVSTYAVFASMRACEQVRTMICYPRLNVKIAASHGGLTPGQDGVTHQGLEDMALMRSLAGMTVIQPADATSTRKAVWAAAAHPGPVYLRLTRDPVPVLYDDSLQFEIGRAITLRDGEDATIIAIGDMVALAVEAADMLEAEGLEVGVLDMHTLKPLDEAAVVRAARATGAIVTAENHTLFGGLGSAVAEVLGEQCPVPLSRVGLGNTFAESGPYRELLVKYRMSSVDIAAAVQTVVSRKDRVCSG
ncbi:MAG: transketolase family protein [Anaerolineae bacterium]|nr:transketolase family protein [Anaerolineae bacterium]